MSFKESNIQGIGAIPSHWEIKEMKYCLLPGSEGIKIGPFGSALKSEMLIEDGYKVYGQENLIKDDFTLGHRFISEEKFKELEVYEITKKDVLISMMGTVGKCKVVPANIKKGIMDSHLIRIRFNENLILPEFAAYLIQDSYYIKVQIDLYSKGSIMSGLNSSIIKNLKLVLPSIEEQKVILKYISKKNTQLNQLVDSKNSLIDLLNQQRQSIITEAVTKGYNPNVKMKDSGVEWVGEVPEHWEETKLKFVIRNLIDAEHKTAPYELDGDYLVARTTNIKKGKLILDDAKYTDYAGYKEWTERGVPKESDVLLTREAPAGEACVVPEEPVLCLGQRVVLLKLAQKINSHFLVWSIYGGVAATYIKLLSQGSTVSHFNMADIKNIPLLLPTIEEQEKIVQYINSKINQFDELIEKIQTQIKQLVDYRQSLIFEAVTGKIDVCDIEIDEMR
ncbi:restriction endonuclease subunit S [Paenibacillus amylolyticus]|uniref:restriction endonuclease subunit S n=1 Tax=Paenibacillus amylolyticus TaxID=1451 RepID=UPI00387A5DD3